MQTRGIKILRQRFTIFGHCGQPYRLSRASVGKRDVMATPQAYLHQRVVKVKFPLSFGFESVGIRYLRTNCSGL